MAGVVVDTDTDDDQIANNSYNLPPLELENMVVFPRMDIELHTRLIPPSRVGKKILDPPAHKHFASSDHYRDHCGDGDGDDFGFGFGFVAAVAGGGRR